MADAGSGAGLSADARRMLVALIGATFSGSFALAMMNIALPTVSETFHIDLTTANWIVLGYNVMAGTTITLAASLLRRIGLRKLMAGAACCLLAGSALAVFAVDFPMLVGARVLQAMSTGIFFPVTSASIEIIVPHDRQGTVFAVNSGLIGVGQALGPLVTGFLLTRFGLHVPFIVPSILGLALIIASLALLHDVEEREKVAIDIPSVALSFAGLATFMYGMSEITHMPLPALGFSLAGAAILGGFAYRQLRLPRPLLNVRTLVHAKFTVGVVLMMLAMMSSIAMSLLLPLFYEGTTGRTAFAAGILIFFPLMAYGALSVEAGRLFDRHPAWPLAALGFALILAGLVGLHVMSDAGLVWGVFGFSFAVYLGVGFIVPPVKASEMAALPHESVADGAALNSTLVQVAECFAAAFFVGILSADVVRLTADHMSRADAYAKGFSDTILISIGIACASLAVALWYDWWTTRRAAAKGDAAPDAAPGADARDGGSGA